VPFRSSRGILKGMPKYIIANWKANKLEPEVDEWVKAVKASKVIEKSLELTIVLCPAFVYLSKLHNLLPGLHLGSQSVSAYPNGSYTGAVTGQQVAQYAGYALLGHVERRKYFGETDGIVAQQVRQAIDAKLTPIVAVDDSNWISQLGQLDRSEVGQIIVMYEPPTAISTSGAGKAAEIDDVLVAINKIRSEFSPMAVLYGGSVSAKNIATYIKHPEIDGVVPGAASLDPEEFIELIRSAHLITHASST
jgi:triosephosphate isomerase (TIM)